MLQLFRNFQADRMDLDELVYLAAVGSQLRAEYEKHNLEEPDWVDVQLKALKREIFARNADKLESRRKEIQARLESLKTPQQKKQELLKEQAEINKKLTAIGA
jgi:phosphoenolpyruvate synthase/pyruvate phosphate dikinase